MKPILFWDFDGVIFDSEAQVYQMWHQVMMAKGAEFSLEQFRTIFEGNSWAKFQEYGAGETEQKEYSKLESNRFSIDTPKEEFPLFPFMDEVVNKLSEKYWN